MKIQINYAWQRVFRYFKQFRSLRHWYLLLLFHRDTLRVYDVLLTFISFGNSLDDHIEDADTRHKQKHIQIFTSIHNNYCLTQLYFTRGDMFRLLIQPSSGQLTIEQELLCAHNMGSHTVYI